MITIPISEIAPWVAFIFLSFILGSSCYLFFKLPDDPTVKGFVIWSVLWFLALAGAYATKLGWIIWK